VNASAARYKYVMNNRQINHALMMMMMTNKEHSFLGKNSVNFKRHFIKFCGNRQQITVVSTKLKSTPLFKTMNTLFVGMMNEWIGP